MSIVIYSMDMPRGCESCDLSYVEYDDANRYCCITECCVNGFYSERAENCPLKEVK